MKRLMHEHALERINPAEMNVRTRRRRSEQISHVMSWVQRYYLEEVGEHGLVRVDTDQPPLARSEVNWRVGRIASSGPLESAGREFFIARRHEKLADGGTKPSELVDGVCGLLVLAKDAPCTPEAHTPTEILEFDVHAQERGQGLGRSLLRFALDTVHPEDDLLLDVSEGNVSAQRYYERLGFTFTDNEPQDHGIFANPDGSPHYHLQMSAPMSIVGQNLG